METLAEFQKIKKVEIEKITFLELTHNYKYCNFHLLDGIDIHQYTTKYGILYSFQQVVGLKSITQYYLQDINY